MVRIVTDTTAGLPVEVAQRYGITVIPQVIILGKDSYLEGVEIDLPTFMHYLETAQELPKTAAPPPELFVQEFQRLVPSREPILCIHPSSEVSGTVRSATLAAQSVPQADIRVLDTRLIASPLASLVTLAAQWAEAGKDIDNILIQLRDFMCRARVYFLVATLKYLAMGGRIGGAAALLGSILQIKPILTLHEGVVEQFDRERTQARALARLKQLVLQQAPHGPEAHLAVMHASVPEQAQSLATDLGRQIGVSQVTILNVPPAIVTHAGPGVLGVSFFVD